MWLALYICSVGGGAAVLFGNTGSPSYFADWSWWQRLLLLLLMGPIAVAGKILMLFLLEGGVLVIWYFLKENPLETIVWSGVALTVILLIPSMF
jgi:hypothetical protein